jgi:hypothetical protein
MVWGKGENRDIKVYLIDSLKASFTL